MVMSVAPTFLLITVSLQCLLWSAKADVYMHNPRGSNDRLDGEGTNRRNGNRVFDSQNNAKGGYNVGERTEKKSKDWYQMEYIMSGPKAAAPGKSGKSTLTIEWTNQHGCGDGDLNCNLILQYKCQPGSIHGGVKRLQMRNGESVGTPIYGLRYYRNKAHKAGYGGESHDNKKQHVLNEPWEWYDKCNKRKRNKGLFTADQKLRGDASKYTRQNPNGNQHGYECPEERDYYPYFHPTDWIDIAVLATNKDSCDYYRQESFNVKPKGECMEKYPDGRAWKHTSVYNNRKECVGGGGRWTEFSQLLHVLSQYRTKTACVKASTAQVPLIWAIPYRSENLDRMDIDPKKWYKCLARPHPPECKEAPYSRSNHLGNGEGVKALTYDWVLPYIPQSSKREEHFKCVLRMRYNISTNDYDQLNTFSESNQQKPHGNLITNQSPIDNDPVVNVGQDEIPLQLAINTAQFGRTFQDRSHIFKLIPRTENIKDKAIYNLNVRGKRGNIVQAYPAVEYDFSPKRLSIKEGDYLHVQWTGSNKNPNGNDGEGRRQTDRSNIVVMEKTSISYPLTSLTPSMFKNAQVIAWRKKKERTRTPEDITIAMATAGKYATKRDFVNAYRRRQVPTNTRSRKYKEYAQLDFYPASYTGLLMRIKKGKYLYMCSRNNNFTNRSQKGRLTVT